jgi:two-component system, chemotaxis family, protein-glutamate methylesterase/glutaminase
MPIKVLVVDDSAFMRKAITNMLQSDPGIQVIWAAKDGAESVKKVMELSPDVVTMDIEMPVMDGIEALRQIMEKKPTPVLMVSSLTTDGAKATLDCLDKGAVDFISKNMSDLSVNIVNIRNDLIAKVKAVAGKKVRRPAAVSAPKAPAASAPAYNARKVHGNTAILAIGTSTGGPKALQDIMPLFPANFSVPILIVQHMPQYFTKSFAERLNESCKLEVVEARDGEPLKPGKVFLAPGGQHLKVKRLGALDFGIKLDSEPASYIHRPSVDVMMNSVAEFFPGRALGVILTGMGSDGKEGMTRIKATGGKTIAQDEKSCVVYGMPKAVIDAGMADKVVPLDDIVGEIFNLV